MGQSTFTAVSLLILIIGLLIKSGLADASSNVMRSLQALEANTSTVDPKTAQDLVANMQKGASDTAWLYDPKCLETPFNDCTPHTHLRIPHQIPTCQDLLHHNISQIAFIGDGFVRHAYVGTVLHLSGNYKKGALVSRENDPRCFYGGHFSEHVTICKARMQPYTLVCDRKIALVYELDKKGGRWFNPKTIMDKYNAIVWGGLNHGNKDAETVGNTVLSEICPKWNHEEAAKKVIWLDPHVRPRHLRCASPACEDGTDSLLKAAIDYRRDMPEQLERVCGVKKVSSVWNETLDLVKNHFSEVESMTFDDVHWGIHVNLLKAHKILSQVLQN